MAMTAVRTAFKDVTWELLEERFGIQEAPRRLLFEGVEAVSPSITLVENLRRGKRSRLINERDRTYRLVSPVLQELEVLRANQVVLLPEIAIEADGLGGNPDFIISGSTTHKILPILSIIEAKREDLEAGLPQCIAALHTAQRLNGGTPEPIYGCVTAGDDWRFVSLYGQRKRVVVDSELYYIADIATLLGVLCQIIDRAASPAAPLAP